MTKSRSSMKTGICTVTLGSGPAQGRGGCPLKVTEFSSTRRMLPSRHSRERTMTRQGNSIISSDSGVITISTPKIALQPTVIGETFIYSRHSRKRAMTRQGDHISSSDSSMITISKAKTALHCALLAERHLYHERSTCIQQDLCIMSGPALWAHCRLMGYHQRVGPSLQLGLRHIKSMRRDVRAFNAVRGGKITSLYCCPGQLGWSL